MSADPNGYLMVFADGPLKTRSNVASIESTILGGGLQQGSSVVARSLFGWPLPDRLGVLCLPDVENVAMWDVDRREETLASGLPEQLIDSPRAVVYRKVRQSEMGEEADAPDSRVMRGAEYELEPAL